MERKLTFHESVTSIDVTVQILNDEVFESSEEFFAILNSDEGCNVQLSPIQARVLIIDDDSKLTSALASAQLNFTGQVQNCSVFSLSPIATEKMYILKHNTPHKALWAIFGLIILWTI